MLGPTKEVPACRSGDVDHGPKNGRSSRWRSREASHLPSCAADSPSAAPRATSSCGGFRPRASRAWRSAAAVRRRAPGGRLSRRKPASWRCGTGIRPGAGRSCAPGCGTRVWGVPAASTVTAILGRHGRLDPAESAKHTPWRRFEHPAPNDLWQLDFKGISRSTATGRCHPLSILDDHSPYLLGLTACADEQDATVRAILTQHFRQFGLPSPAYPDRQRAALGIAGAGPDRPRRLADPPGDPPLARPAAPPHDPRQGRALPPHPQGGDPARRRLPRSGGRPDRLRQLADRLQPRAAPPRLGTGRPRQSLPPHPRPFPEVLPLWEYGPDDIVRAVIRAGQVQYHNRVVYISRALRGQRVALRPTPTDRGPGDLLLSRAAGHRRPAPARPDPGSHYR